MKVSVAWVGKTKERAIQSLTMEYLKRLSRYTPTQSMELSSEAALLKQLDRGEKFVALDTRGKQMSSEELAQFLAEHQNRGTQALLFGIGPADGWSAEALKQASAQISLGRMTLPHELARVVLLEQLYRAFTILKGHPYHLGH
ncbi:MAG: 23S rRNA (pseudouridine(1915)-N(3))-methyltransferase RlmH [Terriglobales bacterium]